MMRKFKFDSKKVVKPSKSESEKGAALVIAIMVMLLLAAFVTLVVSRVSSETIITATDASENRAIAATMASLESTTRDFADVFERKLSPTQADIDMVAGLPVPISEIENGYDFTKIITQTGASEAKEITGGTYAGLYALRDEYEVDITATDKNSRVQTQLRRRFLNDRIPLFQFGIFFEDDLELNRPPLFTFGGRVHTNQNFFVTAYPVSAGGGIYFKSKATAVGELINDIWKTKAGLASGTDNQNGVFIADAGGVFRELKTGKASVDCTSPSGANVFGNPSSPLYNPYLPNCAKRSAWSSEKNIFQGNLDTNTPRLDLPLYRLHINLIELIKRGKNVGDVAKVGSNVVTVTTANQDPAIVSRERFANKEGLRITLADSKNRLPGCATTTDPCGVRLDGGTERGYQPKAMQDGYQATRLNGTRFAQNGKEMWIKVELVNFDYNNNVPLTYDVTEDFLSLGVTERAPIRVVGNNGLEILGYSTTNPAKVDDPDFPENDDIRSIIKLQRFAIPGEAIPNQSGNVHLSSRYIINTSNRYNYVNRKDNLTGNETSCNKNSGNEDNDFAAPLPAPVSNIDTVELAHHLQCVRFGNDSSNRNYRNAIVPFPIQLFDTREGIPNDSSSYTNSVDGSSGNEVPRAGVMSMVDIDVANLRKFFKGDFNGKFPTTTPYATAKGAGESLKHTDVPLNKGWVLFVSDRRGDADFDGEYDYEDVFPDNALQYNEDVNDNGTLERKLYPATNWEAPNYGDLVYRSRAATSDHGYYRRGVRLINGETLPGIYDTVNPDQTKGFTVASENGVYVLGNYNATGVTLPGGSLPAPSQNYKPQDTADHIPAAVISDAVTILSNNWDDAKSFRFPFTQEDRVATPTQVRFAMLTGDGITGNTDNSYNPSPSGGFRQLNGGIHNFKRYLEQWTDVRLNYAGSLVNLFVSRNNNGFFKCCDAVYNPPIRDWTFDTTFLDPNRLPPGTPYIYSMSFTGFQRVND